MAALIQGVMDDRLSEWAGVQVHEKFLPEIKESVDLFLAHLEIHGIWPGAPAIPSLYDLTLDASPVGMIVFEPKGVLAQVLNGDDPWPP